MSSLDGVTGDDLKWLLLNGIGAHLSMPPSSLGAVADVSPQSFLDAARQPLLRLGVIKMTKADARDLLSTARAYAATNAATSKACRLFAALPVAEPRWSAEMDAAELETAGATLPDETDAEEALRASILDEVRKMMEEQQDMFTSNDDYLEEKIDEQQKFFEGEVGYLMGEILEMQESLKKVCSFVGEKEHERAAEDTLRAQLKEMAGKVAALRVPRPATRTIAIRRGARGGAGRVA